MKDWRNMAGNMMMNQSSPTPATSTDLQRVGILATSPSSHLAIVSSNISFEFFLITQTGKLLVKEWNKLD